MNLNDDEIQCRYDDERKCLLSKCKKCGAIELYTYSSGCTSDGEYCEPGGEKCYACGYELTYEDEPL